MAPVRMQVGGQEMARVVLAGFQHHRAGAVAEENAGFALVPVQNPGKGLGADHQRASRLAGADKIVRHGKRIDEPGADRLDIECGALRHAQPGLDSRCRGGEGPVGRRGGEHDQVKFAGVPSGGSERAPRCFEREVRGLFIRRRDPALADAGAFADPGVGGVHAGRELVIGDYALRQIGADAPELRPPSGQEAVAATGGAMRSKAERTSSRKPWRLISTAKPIALANEKASEPPWALTTMPFSPTNTAPL